MSIKTLMEWQRSSAFYTSGEEAIELQEMDTDISAILNQLNGVLPKDSQSSQKEASQQRWRFGLLKLR